MAIFTCNLGIFQLAMQQVVLLNVVGIFVTTFHNFFVRVIDITEKMALGPRGPRLFVCLSKSHTSEIISVY